MPLTSTGKKVMAGMVKQYGAKKGKQVFYSSINAKKAGSKKWHKKSKASYSDGAIKHAMKIKKNNA